MYSTTNCKIANLLAVTHLQKRQNRKHCLIAVVFSTTLLASRCHLQTAPDAWRLYAALAGDSTPSPNSSTPAASAANSTQATAPEGAQGLASPAAAASITPDRAVPAPTAGATSSTSSSQHVGSRGYVATAVVVLLLLLLSAVF
jgi:hypothetical protein